MRTLAMVGRLHIVAIAMLGTFTFGWLFSGSHLYGLALICGLDWFLVNLLNRVVDLKEDQANRVGGTDFVARHRRTILWVGFGVLAASLVLVHLAMPWLLPLRLGYHLLGFAYNWPLFGGRRIKQIYFWKNTASAMGFLITVFGYPLVVAGHSRMAWPGIACAAAFFFLFELSYEVIYDLRDAPGDSLANVRTYPVVHGELGAVRIIDGLIFAAALALVSGYVAGAVPWSVLVMIAAPAIQLAYYKRALRRGITSRDCVTLTWVGALLLLTYHLWIAARLPGVGT